MQVMLSELITEKVSLLNNNIGGQEFKIKPKYFKKITMVESDKYKVQLEVLIENEKTNPFPVDVHVIISGIFKFQNIEDHEVINNYLNIEAVKTIFPYIRTSITNITTSSFIPPILLPIIDVRVCKEKE